MQLRDWYIFILAVLFYPNSSVYAGKPENYDSLYNSFQTHDFDGRINLLSDIGRNFLETSHGEPVYSWVNQVTDSIIQTEGNYLAKLRLAQIHGVMNDDESALDLLERIDEDEISDDVDRMDFYFCYASIYEDLGFVKGVIKYRRKQFELNAELGISKDMNIFLANSYFKLGYPEMAARVLVSSLTEEKRNYGKCNSVGVYYLAAEQADSAIRYFERSLNDYNLSDHYEPNSWFEGLVKGNIGQALMVKGEFQEAIDYLQIDIERSLNGEKDWNAFVSIFELARCYSELNQKDEAFQEIKRAESLYPRILRCSDHNRMKYLEIKAQIYQDEGDLGTAVETLNELKSFEDSLDQVLYTKSNIGMLVAFDLEQKNWKIHQQEKELMRSNLSRAQARLESLEKEAQNRIYAIVIITLFMLLIIVLIVLNHRSKRRKQLVQKNTIINQHKNEIEKVLMTRGEQQRLLEISMIDLSEILMDIDSSKEHLHKNITKLLRSLAESGPLSDLQTSRFTDEMVKMLDSTYGFSISRIQSKDLEDQIALTTAIRLAILIMLILDKVQAGLNDSDRSSELWIEFERENEYKNMFVLRFSVPIEESFNKEELLSDIAHEKMLRKISGQLQVDQLKERFITILYSSF